MKQKEPKEPYEIVIGFTDKDIPEKRYFVRDKREANNMLAYWQREVSCPAFIAEQPKSNALQEILR